MKYGVSNNLSVVILQLHVNNRLVQFASFCSRFCRLFLCFTGRFWIVLACCFNTMFTGVQHLSALIEMHVYLLLNSVRLELRSAASESTQPVQINLGRPKFEFDSAHVKYGV